MKIMMTMMNDNSFIIFIQRFVVVVTREIQECGICNRVIWLCTVTT